jgi:hypothetical protein
VTVKYDINNAVEGAKFPEPKPEPNPFDNLKSSAYDIDAIRSIGGGKLDVDIDLKNKGVSVTYTKEI